MKLFPTSEISKIDRYTIEHEPVRDIDLMERAARKLFEYIESTSLSGRVAIICGPGNNGGDGLALARMLGSLPQRFRIDVYLFDFGRDLAPNAAVNLTRLRNNKAISIRMPKDESELISFGKPEILIDALYGSGLSRSLNGFSEHVVCEINKTGAYIISIDIPSGLLGEDNRSNNTLAIVRANLTLTFQFPKISFMFSENEPFVGLWNVLDIGLHQDAIQNIYSHYFMTDLLACKLRYRFRKKFSHKGNFGHALLISGSYGRMGASVLAAKGCLRSGVGLLTVHVPHGTYPIIQTAVPEAMCDIDDSDLMFTDVSSIESYSAIGIGPAIGQKVNTQRGLRKILDKVSVPLVLDADALNILALNQEWINDLPENTIITPHPLEFDRMMGKSTCGYERMEKAKKLSIERKIIVVLKGANTLIASPNGEVWFNSTGNPGMSTAGSGDVLTGIILGLLAQGYSSFDAAISGVFLHGLAGDIAKDRIGEYSVIASDLIDNLCFAFLKISE